MDISTVQAVGLGILQGITEFLPISSSGHLVLAEHLWGIRTGGVTLEVFLHFGTFFSIITAFRRDLGRLVRDATIARTREAWREAGVVCAGAAPAGIAGLALHDAVGNLFQDARFVVVALIGTGIVLLTTRLFRQTDRPVGWRDAVVIGCAQILAILPGVSRSGITIAAALMCGVNRPAAVRYSLYLALPLLLGAAGVELVTVWTVSAAEMPLFPIVAGTLAAYGVGLAAIFFLMRALRAGRFHWFGLYCLVAGLIGLWYF